MPVISDFPSAGTGARFTYEWATIQNNLPDLPTGSFPVIVTQDETGNPVAKMMQFGQDEPILIGSIIFTGRTLSGQFHDWTIYPGINYWVVDGDVTIS